MSLGSVHCAENSLLAVAQDLPLFVDAMRGVEECRQQAGVFGRGGNNIGTSNMWCYRMAGPIICFGFGVVFGVWSFEVEMKVVMLRGVRLR